MFVMKETYIKFRFTSVKGSTAGLVMESCKFHATTVTALSRLFPYEESRYMKVIECSPEYPSWDEAFAHQFRSTLQEMSA